MENNKIFATDFDEKEKIFASYELNGTASDDREALARYGAELTRFIAVDGKISEEIAIKKIRQIDLSKIENLYELSWVYFGLHAYTEGWGFNEISEGILRD